MSDINTPYQNPDMDRVRKRFVKIIERDYTYNKRVKEVIHKHKKGISDFCDATVELCCDAILEELGLDK